MFTQIWAPCQRWNHTTNIAITLNTWPDRMHSLHFVMCMWYAKRRIRWLTDWLAGIACVCVSVWMCCVGGYTHKSASTTQRVSKQRLFMRRPRRLPHDRNTTKLRATQCVRSVSVVYVHNFTIDMREKKKHKTTSTLPHTSNTHHRSDTRNIHRNNIQHKMLRFFVNEHDASGCLL